MVHLALNHEMPNKLFRYTPFLNPEIKLVSLTGKAGTGKTLLGLLRHSSQQTIQPNIIGSSHCTFIKSRHWLFAGRHKEKIGPYMQPLFDNLSVIRSKFGSQAKKIHLLKRCCEPKN
jgi:PhoH-like ATPase